MVHTFPWRNIVMTLVLSAVLSVGVTQRAEAKISQVKHAHVSLVYCSITAEMPKKAGQSISGSGTIDCNGSGEQVWITLQIQKSTSDGKWTTLGQKDDIGGGSIEYAYTNIACDAQKKTLYRTYITGQYRIGSEWHAIPSHDQHEASISCTK